MELLAASFDWDPSLRDPAAALAYLGRRPEEKLSYEDPTPPFLIYTRNIYNTV